MADDGDKSTATAAQPNLLECKASELSSFLLKNRFENEGVETASFLLECTSTLPNAEAISAQLLGGGEDEEEETESESKESVDLGDALADEFSVGMTTPRGRFQCVVHEKGIQCVNAKGDKFVMSAEDAERIVMFPKPQDCRKTAKDSGNMLLVCFKEEVSFQNKTLTQACLELPAKAPVEDDKTWLELLTTSLDLDMEKDVATVSNPNRPAQSSGYNFQSHKEGTTSTTTGGMPFVQCYHGVKDGVLYPLQEGLLFFKPPMFLPRSSLHSIACGRGSGGSRYVDMALTLNDEKNIEFTNIHRDELGGLNTYIHSVLIPAMKRDAANEDDEKENDTVENENAQVEESESTPGKRKRVQRKASHQARQATRSELDRGEETDSEDDDDDEDGLEAKPDDSESEDDDEDELEFDESGAGKPKVEDEEESEEEFFEEEPDDDESATESEDDGGGAHKKARH